MEIAVDTQIEHDEERQILCQIITNTELLKQLRFAIDPVLFENSYVQKVSQWVLEYYDQTEQAPKKDLENIFIKNKNTVKDEYELENIVSLLKNLSNDWEQYKIVNTEYNAKTAIIYFKKQALKRHIEEVENYLIQGEVEKAENCISTFTRVEKQTGQGVNLLEDYNLIHNAFSDNGEKLFHLQGALQKSLGWFLRGELVGIVGPTKIGKTWCMWHVAHRALMCGLKVLYVNIEMTETLFVRRAWQSLIAQPEHAKKITVPHFNRNGNVARIEERFEEKEGVRKDIEGIKDQAKKLKKHLRDSGIHIITFPRFQATVTDIKTSLSNLEYYDNFVPDVVVVDYADIVKPEGYRKDEKEAENEIWMKLAALAVERNICVVTATQGNRSAWEGKDYGIKGLGGVYDKLSHTGKFFSLTAEEREKEKGISRVKLWFDRAAKGDSREVVVLNNLDIGRWYLDSEFKDNMEY